MDFMLAYNELTQKHIPSHDNIKYNASGYINRKKL